MTPQQLATLYLQQLRERQEGFRADSSELNALYLWEDLICKVPEEAWPVFEDILARVADDDTLEQVWYRLRLLLYRHYSEFHTRAAGLLDRNSRLRLIAGPKALDPATYVEKPFDREAVICAYRTIHRTHELSRAVGQLARSDPHRALVIAIEIIHRGIARGWESSDVMSPLVVVLSASPTKVADDIERAGTESVAVRRVLWRLKRQIRRASTAGNEVAGYRTVPDDIWDRLARTAGQTTDYTDLDVAVPAPQRQLDADEPIIDAWFDHEENFWAFSALHDLCNKEPLLAWNITLDLIDRADDDAEIGTIAAGPLEDLIRKHSGVIWNALEARVTTDARLQSAVRGVWVFPDDGDVFQRFTQLVRAIDAEPS